MAERAQVPLPSDERLRRNNDHSLTHGCRVRKAVDPIRSQAQNIK